MEKETQVKIKMSNPNKGSNNKRRRGVFRQQTKKNLDNSPLLDSKMQKSQFLRCMNNLYGRHYAINAKPQYNFKEQWQNRNFYGVEEGIYNELIRSQTIIAYFYTTIILTINIGLFWGFTTLRMVQIQKQTWSVNLFIIGCITTAIDVGVKIRLKMNTATQSLDLWDLLIDFKGQITIGVYCAINIILSWISTIYIEQLLFIIDGIVAILIYTRTKTLFKSLKVRSYTSSFKHKMKLVDLLGTLLLFLHIFALLLYSASFYDPHQNWTTKIGEGAVQGLDRYYYAFYFAATTMLTIGYGDLSPTNKIEILAILPVQIIGVAVFSYIINQIGYTVGSVRKEEEQLEHNLSTLAQMSSFYQMDPELSAVAKQHLISNQKSISTIYPEDENTVLDKLSDDLRQTITSEKGLDIVKSSLFFLCHWSKRFQIEAAKNLQKKILHPNEMVVQAPGKERIYVVKSGRLDIFTNCNSNYKQQFKRLLKSIEPKSNERICDNIYGYTNLASRRPVRLSAVSKDFTSVFYMDKEQFMSCVNESDQDREYWFEIKAKIQESKCCESWQTPSVLNIRQHYHPSQYYILKRFRSKMQRVKNYQRNYNRCKPLLVMSKIALNIERSSSNDALNTDIIISEGTVSERTLPANHPEMYIKDKIQQNQKKQALEHFESIKDYYNFFRSNNCSNVLLKYERRNPKIEKRNSSDVNMCKFQVQDTLKISLKR